MIITSRAASTIQALTAHGNDCLRIALKPGGCCGTYYQFSLSRPQPGDVAVSAGLYLLEAETVMQDATLYLQPQAAAVLMGATLDYGPNLKPPRFRVLRNPNTLAKCPCGRSFGAPFPGRPTPHCQAYCPMPWDQEP